MEREKVRTMLSKEMVDSLDWIDDLTQEELMACLVIDGRNTLAPIDVFLRTKQYISDTNQ